MAPPKAGSRVGREWMRDATRRVDEEGGVARAR